MSKGEQRVLQVCQAIGQRGITPSSSETQREGTPSYFCQPHPTCILGPHRCYRVRFPYFHQVEISDDRVTGKIIGENCKGTEKIRRLCEVFTQEEIGDAICYADSRSDTPLMKS